MSIKCDDCGKFISYDDIESKKAIHRFYDTWNTTTEDVKENVESVCKKCNKKTESD